MPEHAEKVLSPKYFASENKFIGLAQALKKKRIVGKNEYYDLPVIKD